MKIQKSELWKIADNKYQCPYCSKCFSSKGICSHIWRIHDENGKKHKTGKHFLRDGKIWNKGLTKDIDSRIKQTSESLKKYYTLHGGIWTGKTHSEETRKKLSNAAKRGLENGTWHTGNSWLGVIEYDSKFAGKVYLMGKWEIEYAKYLDEHNIKWSLNQKRFKYKSDHLPTKTGYYKPDFYLVESNEYVEIKGYESKVDQDKWSQFPHRLRVLRGKDLLALGLKIKL